MSDDLSFDPYDLISEDRLLPNFERDPQPIARMLDILLTALDANQADLVRTSGLNKNTISDIMSKPDYQVTKTATLVKLQRGIVKLGGPHISLETWRLAADLVRVESESSEADAYWLSYITWYRTLDAPVQVALRLVLDALRFLVVTLRD
jgi:hypothetical protein